MGRKNKVELDGQAKAEEHRKLLEEMGQNRKFVFERPLLIIGVGLAAFANLADKTGLELVSIPFLGILLFNLWFTFNRLQSNARIIAYIHLVHDKGGELKWIGWESALRKYRDTIRRFKKEFEQFEYDRTNKKELGKYDNTGFYKPIFAFHIFLAFIVVMIPLSQPSMTAALFSPGPQLLDVIFASVHIAGFLGFVWISYLFRPIKIKRSIEMKRVIWQCTFKHPSCAIKAIREEKEE